MVVNLVASTPAILPTTRRHFNWAAIDICKRAKKGSYTSSFSVYLLKFNTTSLHYTVCPIDKLLIYLFLT